MFSIENVLFVEKLCSLSVQLTVLFWLEPHFDLFSLVELEHTLHVTFITTEPGHLHI